MPWLLFMLMRNRQRLDVFTLKLIVVILLSTKHFLGSDAYENINGKLTVGDTRGALSKEL